MSLNSAALINREINLADQRVWLEEGSHAPFFDYRLVDCWKKKRRRQRTGSSALIIQGPGVSKRPLPKTKDRNVACSDRPLYCFVPLQI